jgi:hypothetical protein
MAAEVKELIADGAVPRRHPLLRAFRLGALLDDGVITAEEIAELPSWHPLRNPEGKAVEYLSDGKIPVEELRSLLPEGRLSDG